MARQCLADCCRQSRLSDDLCAFLLDVGSIVDIDELPEVDRPRINVDDLLELDVHSLSLPDLHHCVSFPYVDAAVEVSRSDAILLLDVEPVQQCCWRCVWQTILSKHLSL